jgi:hypothetical protein
MKSIRAKCPNCKEERVFEYLGVQEVPKSIKEKFGEPELYNCLGCMSTLALSSIQNYNNSLENKE